MEVDHSIERVLNALKRQGLEENTLLLFSSDHGPASYAGNILKATPGQIHLLEEQGHHSNGPHRGYKFSVYEGGLHVPLIAHWPGGIRPGSESNALGPKLENTPNVVIHQRLLDFVREALK